MSEQTDAELYTRALAYFFSPQLVAWAAGDRVAGVEYLRRRAVEGGGGAYGPGFSCQLSDGHLRVWRGVPEAWNLVTNVTVQRAARDAWDRAHAPAVQGVLL